ncbi:MAG: hypothetical protein CMJ78_04345 [Planctomycetaceae bacterium]|nr:hypothetical protein [Planctomycetaceae bacterium]
MNVELMKTLTLLASLLVVVLPTFADDQPAKPTPAKDVVSFAGQWSTSYGVLTLTQNGVNVEGNYRLGTVKGKVEGRVLILRYKEPGATGEAKFTIAKDRKSFTGVWRQDGTEEWLVWNGKRRESRPLGFEGLWETSFGLMRLSSGAKGVRGVYEYPSGNATIEGAVKDGRLNFRYEEPEAKGSGWFELSEDKMSISGKWRPDGSQAWQTWTGTRRMPKAGRVWLVILEANWERSIEEPEYAFGDMLEKYFTMASARHVSVRHRFFHDATDLKRFCEKVQFIAEPVVVLISTHGTSKGITVFGKTISADVIAKGLAGASNVKLLHLSGCGMMSGSYPRQVHTLLKDQATFPISGYKTTVAWDASALGDFTFLSLLLIRGLEPDAAVRQAIIASPYLGETQVRGSSFRPLGLNVLPPPQN